MDDDVLAETLQNFGMTGVFYAVSELGAPWGIDMPPMPGDLVFHLVTRGSAVVDVDGTRQTLTPGDVVLVPHGTGHAIVGEVGARADAAVRPAPRRADRPLRAGPAARSRTR